MELNFLTPIKITSDEINILLSEKQFIKKVTFEIEIKKRNILKLTIVDSNNTIRNEIIVLDKNAQLILTHSFTNYTL